MTIPLRAASALTMTAALLLRYSTVPAGSSTTLPRARATRVGRVSLETLHPGQRIDGFRSVAVYLNDADRPMGGRFIHERSGFVLDLLQIQSVPQGFIWTITLPTSDKGEPHTQEHLLLGKGSKGRSFSSQESLSLTESSAFTGQWRTCYHFYTTAGADVFYPMLEKRLDALLHPDYTDEEIRREVRNFGITQNPADRSLRLEEKGSVYNEMVSTVNQPGSVLYRALEKTLFGSQHPLSYESGGTPAGLRELRPDEIRRFHRQHYTLGNMGMILSLPREMPLSQALARVDAMLHRVEPVAKPQSRSGETAPLFPPCHPSPSKAVQRVEYPDPNATRSSPVALAWPPVPHVGAREELLLQLFLDNLAGDESSNLYRLLINTKTRVMDTGAQGISAWISDDMGDQGLVCNLWLDNVEAARVNPQAIEAARQKVRDEIARIAYWKDGSPELAEFNGRLRSFVLSTRRNLSKFVNTPPRFGFRGIGTDWLEQLRMLERSGGYRRSVLMKPELAFVERLLSTRQNFWRTYLAQWKLLGTVPYAIGSRADPELVSREVREREARIQAEVTRLQRIYATTDDQETLRRYEADYNAATRQLEEIARHDTPARFVDSPPLTPDDSLVYKASALPGSVPLVASTFDTMTGATTGIALRLEGVPEDDLVYLALLPELMSQVGVIENGRPVPYETMQERLRKEILSINASFDTYAPRDRYELVLRAAGNDARESQRAIGWMQLFLYHPDWRPENLPRLRDLVNQSLSALRNRRQGLQETWVRGVSGPYRFQTKPLFLATSSFLTRAHNVQRLRWMLMEVKTLEDRELLARFLDHLSSAGQKAGREELKSLLAALQGDSAQEAKLPPPLTAYREEFERLPASAQPVAREAGKDLEQDIAEIPDANLPGDWAYLCGQMRQDMLQTPERTLAALDARRRRLLKRGSARVFMIGASATQAALRQPLRDLLAALEPGTNPVVAYSDKPLVIARLREREPHAEAPVYVGLVHPTAHGGVVMNSAAGVSYQDIDTESLLRFLSFNLYAGGGAQSIFMKTWAAGLAYGNGLGSNLRDGRISYYADQAPELPQTLRFVIEELAKAEKGAHDPSLTEHAIALAFYSRAAAEYETRGEAMASDLVDGVTPEVVRRFRKAILALRQRSDLADTLYERMPKEYARVLPGSGIKGAEVPGAIYFIIGAEKQFAAYEAYLKSVEGPETRLYRLYPRDFWMTAPVGRMARQP